MRVTEGRRRVAIENVQPEIDCGRFPIKRTVGETVVVEAVVFADGHDLVACALQYRTQGETAWTEVRMKPLVNDRYRGEFPVGELGRAEYTLSGWIDRFGTWRRDLSKRVEADQEVAIDLEVGAGLLESAARRAKGQPGRDLRAFAKRLRGADADVAVETALSEGLRELMDSYPDRNQATSYGRQLSVTVDRERARFSAWYELFPRSTAAERGPHGTFKAPEA